MAKGNSETGQQFYEESSAYLNRRVATNYQPRYYLILHNGIREREGQIFDGIVQLHFY